MNDGGEIVPSGPSFDESGWQLPVRCSQHTLFGDDAERSLAAARVTADEANQWFEWGWLSSMPAFIDAVDEPMWAELLFVRDLAASKAPREAISALLKQLPRPYHYDSCRVAYSFRYGWVELPVRHAAPIAAKDLSVRAVRRWVETAARQGRREDLQDLLDAVFSAINAVDS